MKVAILHEMLVKFGWAEKVVQTFQKMYPDADLYTLIYDEKSMWEFFPPDKVTTTKITQRVFKILKNQRFCLPFMSRAVESLDFSEYDLVICSSSAFAHWAITKPECKFVVYCHAPARYMWDWTNEYKAELWIWKNIKWNILWFFLNRLFLQLRVWDYMASKRPDITLANSSNTQSRITKYHRKDSIVLYPPIETSRFQKEISTDIFTQQNSKYSIWKNNYYIIISALTEFKRLDIAIKWFNNLDQKLVIIWAWDYKAELQKLVESENIIFTWPQYWDDLVSLVQNSLWLIFPWEEDFWMVPVEALAAGKPVFALSKWWLLETVTAWITWEFFDDVEGDDFATKFKSFHSNNLEQKYKAENCIKKAEEFSEESFEKKFKEIIR